MIQHRALVENTAPATQIVSTSDMKSYLDVDNSADDTLIDEAIIASRIAVEKYLGRSLINTTWNLWLDEWPRDRSREDPPEGVYNLPIDHFDQTLNFIELPRPPLVSVTSIKYYDTSDTVATFAATNYLVDIVSDPGRVVLNSTAQWPTTLLRPGKAIDIEFVAGYGSATTDVPDLILLAVKQMVKYNYAVMTRLYEVNGVPFFDTDINKNGLTESVEKLLMPYRVFRI